jgi:hypothetical protein
LPLDLTLNRACEFAILDLKQKILLPISRVLGYGGFAAMTLVILLGIWSLVRLVVAFTRDENATGIFSLNYIYPQLVIVTVFAVETLMYVGLAGIIMVAWLSDYPAERRVFRIFLIPYIVFLVTYGVSLIT